MCDKRMCACKKKDSSRRKKKGVRLDESEVKRLEEDYQKFVETDGRSLLKKHLTKEIFDKLKTRVTEHGASLRDVIRSGLANPDSGIGIYAPDAESYVVFAELFNAVIEEYHGGFKWDDVHPELDWGNPEELGNVDPEGKYVISSRIRCARSLVGYPFNPNMTEAHYREIQNKVRDTLSALEGDLKGTYYSLESMDAQTKQRLIDEHFLFKEGDRFLEAANANRFWPVGRGIFFNEAKTFLVWCNEEDHLRLISMEKGGDLSAVYGRLVRAATQIGQLLPFSRQQRFGYLTFCPTNLGTTIRASVHIRLPLLASDYSKLDEVASTYGLQIRGTRGEHSESEGGVYDISNKRRLGLTEREAVFEMSNGIVQLIKLEKQMEEQKA